MLENGEEGGEFYMADLQNIGGTDTLDTIIEKINNFMTAYSEFQSTASQKLQSHNDIIKFGADIIADKVSHKLYAFKAITELKAYELLYPGDLCILLGSSTEFDGDVQFYKIREMVDTETESSPTLLITTKNYVAELVPDTEKEDVKDEISEINSEILQLNTDISDLNDALAELLETIEELESTVETNIQSAVTTANSASQTANAVKAQIGDLTFSVTEDSILKITYPDDPVTEDSGDEGTS